MEDPGKHKNIDEDFLKEGAKKINEDDLHKVYEKLNEIIDKVKNSKILKDLWDDIQAFIDLIKAYITNEYTDTPWWVISSITFTLLYILNPIDLIPDFIFGIGFLDDAALVSICLNLIKVDVERFKKWKAEQKK